MTPRLPRTAQEFMPSEVAARHRLSDLPEQFVLAESDLGPETWPMSHIGGWKLRRHPTLAKVELRDAAARPLGWLLGYPIDARGVLLVDGAVLDDVPASAELLRRWFDQFAGRWLALVVDGPDPYVRLDAVGSLSAVFNAEHRIVASTPNLVPYHAGVEDHRELIRAMGVPFVNARYILGLTPRHGVLRLLPNHRLNLTTFECTRYWPTSDLDMGRHVGDALSRIAALIERNLQAMVNAVPCAMALTAGRDSRMLLACARTLVPSLDFYTIRVPDTQGELDARVAGALARQLGLRHTVVPYIEPSADDLDEWLFRVGCSTTALRGWRASTTYKQLDPRWTMLVGMVGEVGRASNWRHDDAPDTRVGPDRLLRLTMSPDTELTRTAAQRWLDELPTDNALTILNLFKIEQSLGCWAGVWPYAQFRGPGFVLFPMNHAEIVRCMIETPAEYQRSGRLAEDVIAQAWPELLAWPFNQEEGLRRVLRYREPAAWRTLARRGARRAIPSRLRLRRES